MTLYLDASALAKRYLAETGTAEVMAAIDVAPLPAASIVAYAELRAPVH